VICFPRESAEIRRDYSAAVFGLASAVRSATKAAIFFTPIHGTVSIAGHVVEGWRWVFYLNLPMGLIALFMVIGQNAKLSHAAKGSIDYFRCRADRGRLRTAAARR